MGEVYLIVRIAYDRQRVVLTKTTDRRIALEMRDRLRMQRPAEFVGVIRKGDDVWTEWSEDT